MWCYVTYEHVAYYNFYLAINLIAFASQQFSSKISCRLCKIKLIVKQCKQTMMLPPIIENKFSKMTALSW